MNELLVLSGWVFLPSDKYGKIYKTEKRQILTLASKNGCEFCDRFCLHLNDLTRESHWPSLKFQGHKPLKPLFGG